ncbi:amidohydrolase family protein [Nannocystis sp. SCPEA4]|uniref:amidohydrolase family protein n=1 Tax=Nannocystis sp. SCPEA4 TaxID=2996787 RepID=UPI0022716527|nr:amidohydrolase family protein [Nannocystis sp. SCPEA4]MCY1060796.1 amidohydrolase family protein [Nannocystis sp. SCPEA4]
MAPPFDLLVRGGTCALHGVITVCDLGVTGGRVVAIGDLAGAEAERELDARHLHVLPGVLDTGGYLRDEGGSALVLAGVTAVFDAHPHPTTAAGLEDKLSRARGRAHCDYAFFIAAATDHLDDLDRLERLPGCSGVVLSLGTDDEPLHRALFCGQRRVTVSCEPDPHPEPVAAGAAVDLYRDEGDAARALQRFLNMAKRAGRRVHVSSVDGDEALALLMQHRELATVGLAAADLDLAAPTAAALWRAVAGGLVDALGSGPEAAPGGPHLLLPAMLEHVHAGRLGLPQLVELLSSGPARIYNVARKGRIALGYDADLVLVDLGAEHTHAGVRYHGWPVATVLRGELLARDGRIVAPPGGAPVRFSDTLRMVVL